MRIDKRITKKILGSSRDSFNRGLDDWNYVNRGFLDSEVDDLSNYKKSVLIDDKINYAKDRVLKRGDNLGLIARHGTNIVAGGGLGYLGGLGLSKIILKRDIHKKFYKDRNPRATDKTIEKDYQRRLKRIKTAGALTGIALSHIIDPGKYLEKRIQDHASDRAFELGEDYRNNYRYSGNFFGH